MEQIEYFFLDLSGSTKMESGNSSHKSAKIKNSKNEVLKNKLSSAISLILQDTNINELSTNTSSKLFKENNILI